MTNPADALRVVMGKVNAVSDGDWLSRLVNEYETAYDCADFLRDHGPAIAEALEDARRYRFSREAMLDEDGPNRAAIIAQPEPTTADEFDTAIDAAIAATEAAHES